MRQIIEFSEANCAKELAEICKQTKTAAAWIEEDFINEAAQKTSKIFVLTDTENNIQNALGFCAVRFVCEDAEITNFAILPSAQRKYLGTELFAYTLNFLKKCDVKNITLEVSSVNEPARKFYEKFKFAKVNTRKNFYNMGEDALVLKLEL